MALTSVGAIYATQSKLLQRIYIPHADDSEIAQQHVGLGESILSVPIATYQQGGCDAVQAVIGTPTFSGRCAVVDGTNTVINLIMADPAVYSDPQGHQVISHDSAMLGDTWDGTKFSRQFAEVDRTSGTIVGVTTQPILSPTPLLNALNYMMSVDPNSIPIVGATVPSIVAKIAAKGVV